jgi:predicted nucleotidyltransferase component of viral defense system
MLHYRAIEPKALELLKRLRPLLRSERFFLSGGTALALQKGHRLSIDLDFFTREDLETSMIFEVAGEIDPEFKVDQDIGNALSLQLSSVKVDFLRHNYPFLKEPELTDGIPLMSVPDIAAMKVNAVANRGAKKDFWDIFILLEDYTINELLDLAIKKYSNTNRLTLAKSLAYFTDAENQPDPITIGDTTWEDVKKRIQEVVKTLV